MTTTFTLKPDASHDTLVTVIARAIEAKEEYVRNEMAPLLASLRTSTDIRQTLQNYMPDAEWDYALMGCIYQKLVVEEAPRWMTEFSTTFDCPPCPEPLADQSWHNDVAPSYGYYSEGTSEMLVSIWINHPDPERRELGGERFFACGREGENYPGIIQTNNWDEAVAAAKSYLEATAKELNITL